MCKRTYCLVPIYFILLSSTLLFGCENPDDKMKAVSPIVDESSIKQNATNPISTATASKEDASNTEMFAPSVENERRGIWLGGPPPMNKGASGIDTYYRIKAQDKPNHLTMTLRFEGIVADDAKVEFKPIDGATFKQPDQRSQWQLKPNTASEITFTIVVPDGASYLTLNTFQNKQGASRAFFLTAP